MNRKLRKALKEIYASEKPSEYPDFLKEIQKERNQKQFRFAAPVTAVFLVGFISFYGYSNLLEARNHTTEPLEAVKEETQKHPLSAVTAENSTAQAETVPESLSAVEISTTQTTAPAETMYTTTLTETFPETSVTETHLLIQTGTETVPETSVTQIHLPNQTVTETPLESVTEETNTIPPETTAEETNTEAKPSENIAGVYSSKSGIITLNSDGTGTISFQDTVFIRWNDKKLIGEDFAYPYTISGDTITVDVDGMERSFTKGGETPYSDVQNPIMNFVGTYQSGRAVMRVKASGNNSAEITISWAGSAASEAVWTMSGECIVNEDSILVSYQDSTCRVVEYNSDGTVASDATEYIDGSGTLTFSGNTVKWDDDTENADDVMLFEYIPIVE